MRCNENSMYAYVITKVNKDDGNLFDDAWEMHTHTHTNTNTMFYYILSVMIAEISDSTMSNIVHIHFQSVLYCESAERSVGKNKFENGTRANISLTNGGMHPALCHSCKLYINCKINE